MIQHIVYMIIYFLFIKCVYMLQSICSKHCVYNTLCIVSTIYKVYNVIQ